jgi:F-type H+-transporting ATPase subunit gamma
MYVTPLVVTHRCVIQYILCYHYFSTFIKILFMFTSRSSINNPTVVRLLFRLHFVISSHKKLKVRLASYSRLHDLTKAIQLVALSKLKIIQDSRKEENESLSSFKKPYTKINTFDSVYNQYLIIPVTSDKSCCGAINTNIIDELYNYVVILRENQKEFFILLIGKKGKGFLKKNYSSNYKYNVSNITKEVISLLTTVCIVEKMQTLKTDICIIIFNHLYSIFEQGTSIYVVVSFAQFIRILAIQLNSSHESIFWSALLSANDRETSFLQDYYLFVITLLFLKAFHENELSELGGRITSMQNASKNALELMQRLKILFNKARQAYITNELIEIVSCLNALVDVTM